MRRDGVLLAVLSTVTACVAPMYRMEPALSPGQDARFSNGAPIISSRGSESIVVVVPLGSATGRHAQDERLGFVVAVKNLQDSRIEVAESNLQVFANGKAARVVLAHEAEDEARRSAALAHAANAIGAAVEMMASSTAGPTTHDGTERRQEARAINAEARANAENIRAHEQKALAGVAGMFQRSTVDPGESYAGIVVVEPPHSTACRVMAEPSQGYGRPAIYRPGPCAFELIVTIGKDSHRFGFSEVP